MLLSMKILIVEDEVKLNKALKTAFETKGFAVDSAFDGEEGERLAKWNEYDVAILDIMMPKRDGTEVCKNLRLAGKKMPIIMLTAKDTTEDKVTGLEIGADDYLGKPFAFDELLARIRSLLRRPPLSVEDVYEWGTIRLDTRSQKVTIGGNGTSTNTAGLIETKKTGAKETKEKEISLTLREYSLLEYLLRNRGKVLTRDDLLEHVWDRNHDTLSNVVDVHMKNLRKKLPKKYAALIETIRGKGFRIV
jgi:DNA-binding response OmpR family regulator